MARALRIELAGGSSHVTSRTNRREASYRDDANGTAWLAVFAEICARFNQRCHAYREMTNHDHVVEETTEGNLSKGMRQLNGVFTQRVSVVMSWSGTCFRAASRTFSTSAMPVCSSWRVTSSSIRCLPA